MVCLAVKQLCVQLATCLGLVQFFNQHRRGISQIHLESFPGESVLFIDLDGPRSRTVGVQAAAQLGYCKSLSLSLSLSLSPYIYI